jgi:hypothetical protein
MPSSERTGCSWPNWGSHQRVLPVIGEAISPPVNGGYAYGLHLITVFMRYPGVCLLALVVLSGCEQQIAIRRLTPLATEGPLRVTAATLDREGNIVVVGAANGVRGLKQELPMAHPDLQGDLVAMPTATLSGGRASFTGLGMIDEMQGAPNNSQYQVIWNGLSRLVGFSTDAGRAWINPIDRLETLDPSITAFAAADDGIYVERSPAISRNGSGGNGYPGVYFFSPILNSFDPRSSPPWPGIINQLGQAIPAGPCLLGSTLLRVTSSDCARSWNVKPGPNIMIGRFIPDLHVPRRLYAIGRDGN